MKKHTAHAVAYRCNTKLFEILIVMDEICEVSPNFFLDSNSSSYYGNNNEKSASEFGSPVLNLVHRVFVH